MTSSIMELFTGLRRKRRGGSGGGGKKQHGKVGPVEDEEDLGGVGGRQHSYEGIAMVRFWFSQLGYIYSVLKQIE
jgi:hypothetical protein